MESEFVQGLFVKRNPKAPDFVKANLSIRVDEFIGYLKAKENNKGWVNIDILLSKKNILWAKLNDFEAKPQEMKQDDLDNASPEQDLPF